ncbi:hypothetical protein BCV63_11315 [Cylindrospermopsis raciborskii CS-508]|uniref:hypothetical protein n=1 Tax=Cylindrospermopsis raciborskii TaxID=77022 RepID=UPI0008DDC4F9|nr:hypothetical protein [Cylindrospermopsis raciborskii]OHY39892.1 hypothetical protein BCV63_11315 [Cylindrospermopsis raciborskii CS-508]
MDAYQHPEALEALQKEQLVQIARHIGLETSLRGKAKTAPALKAEIRNYLNYCEQLTIPEVMPLSG